MAVVVPFIGAAIGSAAFAGTALAAYGASIGWIAGALHEQAFVTPSTNDGAGAPGDIDDHLEHSPHTETCAHCHQHRGHQV